MKKVATGASRWHWSLRCATPGWGCRMKKVATGASRWHTAAGGADV